MVNVPALRVAVVILAAGRSVRMGRPKMLLPWGTGTILAHQVGLWRELGAVQVGVVCAADDHAIAAELDRLAVPAGNRLVNPDPARGMFSSIQCAAAWAGWPADVTHWVVALGDQPHVRRDTLRALLEFARNHPGRICQPRCEGRLGHPVVMPAAVFWAIAASAASTLRAFLDAQGPGVAACEVSDPGLALDVDTPEDYRRALAIAE